MKKTNPQTPVHAGNQLANLYDKDEVAWLEKSVQLIRKKRFQALDFQNLAQYLEDMAKRDRREVKSRLVSLLVHLLKWQFQSNMRSGSWRASIVNQRGELEDEFESATLKKHASAILPQAYARAVKEASAETGLAEFKFPPDCPYTLEYLLSDQWPESGELE